MRTFSNVELKQISECLNDKGTTLKMANSIIDGRVQESNEDALVKQMMDMWGKTIVAKNIEQIFNHSQSPIERIFLNSLHFFGLMNDTRIFIFTPRNISVSQKIEEYHSIKKGMNKLRKQIIAKSPEKDTTDIDIELLELVEQNGDKEFHDLIQYHHYLYDIFDLKNSFHFTLQNFVPGIKIDNMRVKPDITIWVPEHTNFRLLVECDGFQFHSNKEAFTRDRKKDRELNRNGYTIYRYSGTEIYNKPMETSFDLYNHLLQIRHKKPKSNQRR